MNGEPSRKDAPVASPPWAASLDNGCKAMLLNDGRIPCWRIDVKERPHHDRVLAQHFPDAKYTAKATRFGNGDILVVLYDGTKICPETVRKFLALCPDAPPDTPLWIEHPGQKFDATLREFLENDGKDSLPRG